MSGPEGSGFALNGCRHEPGTLGDVFRDRAARESGQGVGFRRGPREETACVYSCTGSSRLRHAVTTPEVIELLTRDREAPMLGAFDSAVDSGEELFERSKQCWRVRVRTTPDRGPRVAAFFIQSLK